MTVSDYATLGGSALLLADEQANEEANRSRMEQRLQQAQEQLLAQERQAIVAELAGAAAHELNQPLTSVRNYATLLRRLLETGTSACAAAEVIEGEAERMAEIVRKIGKITKYETKSYVGKQKILDLDRASEEGVPVAAPANVEGTDVPRDEAPRSEPRRATGDWTERGDQPTDRPSGPSDRKIPPGDRPSGPSAAKWEKSGSR